MNKPYDGNVFETEPAVNSYLGAHPNAPVKTLRDILLSGKVVPSRVRVLMNSIGRSTEEAGYLPILRSIDGTRRVVFSLLAEQRRVKILTPATPGADWADRHGVAHG